jgi:hypothetical protein
MAGDIETPSEDAGRNEISIVTQHTPLPWRGYREKNEIRHSWQWMLDSDTRGCMALLELPDLSTRYKKQNPEWAAELRATITEIDANFALIKASPRMLQAMKDVYASLTQLCADVAEGEDVPAAMQHDWIMQDIAKLHAAIIEATTLEDPVEDAEL